MDIVLRKKDFHEIRVSGETRDFLLLSVAELIAQRSDEYYTIPDCDFMAELDTYCTNYQGYKIVRKGGMISAIDMLRHSIDFTDVCSVLTAAAIVQAGGAQDTNIKIEHVIRTRRAQYPFDSHEDDLKDLAISVIFDALRSIFDSSDIFNFRVGSKNDLPVSMLSDMLRRLRIEYNSRILHYTAGLDLIDTAERLCRVLYSDVPEVVRFSIDNDLAAIADNSPLCLWFKGTNLAVFRYKTLDAVFNEGVLEGLTKEFKRLKLYKEHQTLVVDVLNRLYVKIPAQEARSYFTSDVERLTLPGLIYNEGDAFDVRTPINAIQFLDINLVSTTHNQILGLRINDEIANVGLRMYSQTEDDMSDLVKLHQDIVDAQIANFEPVRMRALERMSEVTADERTFECKITPFLVPDTIAAIFSTVTEVDGQLYYDFESATREIENIIILEHDDANQWYRYRTTDPRVVARYADYTRLINGSRKFEVNLDGTLPTATRNVSIYDGTYCKTSFVDMFDSPLAYFDDYQKLLRPANNNIRDVVSFSSLRNPGFDLETYRDLFTYLQIIRDPNSEFYRVLDDTVYMQFKNKASFFFDKMSELGSPQEKLGERLTFTHYVNETIRPVIIWLNKQAGMRILPFNVLHPALKRSSEYKLACFHLANEILRLFGKEFKDIEMAYIVPESLISQIGLVK